MFPKGRAWHAGGMATFLAFLRAINLGSTRAFPKDDIRRAVEQAGFTGVATHINTGNVRLETRMRARGRIEKTLEDAFLADRGFPVPTIVFSAAEFTGIARDAAELAEKRSDVVRHYIYLLKHELDDQAHAAVAATRSAAGEIVVRGRAAHALLGPGYQAGQVDPLGAAKLLGVSTSRNAVVVSTLAAKWC